MGFLRNLRLWLRPLQMTDPDFGNLVFMHMNRHPERSYWEAEWNFPATNKVVVITMRGGEDGPRPEVRQFYLGLPARFDSILSACRSQLDEVFRNWRGESLPENILSALDLGGFGVEDPPEDPVKWDISFETRDGKWLGILIPFVGDKAMEAVVDT